MTTTEPRTSIVLPEPTHQYGEQSAHALVEHSMLQTKRLLMTWTRSPGTLFQVVLYPVLTMLMLRIVLGDSVTAATGRPSIYGTVPMMTLIAAMSGATVSALGLSMEKSSGLLGRFWTMPMHRASGLMGRLIAEGLRVFLTTVVIVVAGVALGFRFEQGFLAALGLLCLPVVFGVGFAVFVTSLVAYVDGILLANVIGIMVTLLMFFNTGFVPAQAYPEWLQGFVENQPMSCAIDAMIGLSLGGPVAEPLMKTIIWSAGLFVVFLVPAVRGYRKAAETGS
ncbi:ABC transporter permease [Aldersonia sp. NBC_00410]|uniref:ABC transporter permease n=1 Tax=Aldersonia sp. NBC_00410 TaxID=2975954 RepID=UPI0022595181|nr:ABC transporter permease [Aldersonia sp. NBC_00410]MCX5044008.1 ABC transporter permease [Aldersonia sp. NBC_00410]